LCFGGQQLNYKMEQEVDDVNEGVVEEEVRLF
jgi:hypothetical protein